MASALTSPYQDDTIREVVPKVAKIAGKLAQSSVITDRRRVRIVPQSGQTYTLGSGGTGTVNFLIQDGAAYADLQSACISFTASIQGTGGQTSILDDGAWSVFRRLLVSVNSTQADDIDRVAVKANQEIYATCSQSWYDGPGSVMGLWKNSLTGVSTRGTGANPTLVANLDVPAHKFDVFAKANTEFSASVNNSVANQRYSFPVSLLSNFFRAEQLYPCRNAGQLYLQLQLAGAAEASINFVSATGVPGIAPSITLSDMTLELDYVSLHPAYLSMMDTMMTDPEEAGVHWAFDAHTVGSAVLSAAGGDQSAVFTKASQNLRSIHVVAQPQAALGTAGLAYGVQSTFGNPSVNSIQYRAGSEYFPAFQSVGAARLAMDLFGSYGSPDAVDKASIVDERNFSTLTHSATAAAPVVDNINYLGTAVAGIAVRAGSDCFIHGYCFDRLKRAKLEGEDLDGINTLSSSGSQIVCQINTNAAGSSPAPPATNAEAMTLTGILRYTRVLRLHGGATQILG